MDEPADTQGYLYPNCTDERSIWIILPINKDDAQRLGTSWKDADAESLLRLEWVVARHWKVGPTETKIGFSHSGWLMLRIEALRQVDETPHVSVELPGGRSVLLHLRNPPRDYTEVFDPHNLSDVTATLDLRHPLRTIACMASLFDFESLWPIPEEEGIDRTLAQLLGQTQTSLESRHKRGQGSRTMQEQMELSDNEVHALVEMIRKDKWGRSSVPEEALKRYLRDTRDPQEGIRKLIKKGLIQKRKGNTYSLNSKRRSLLLQLRNNLDTPESRH
jgi:hypothetical protein